MKLELLPYNESLQLKELGFDWPCDEFYKVETGELFDGGDFVDAENHNAYPDVVSAPTLDLACKWLRDVHKIRVAPFLEQTNGGKSIYSYQIEYFYNGEYVRRWPYKYFTESRIDGAWETHELAQLEGIKDAIEHLQKQLK